MSFSFLLFQVEVARAYEKINLAWNLPLQRQMCINVYRCEERLHRQFYVMVELYRSSWLRIQEAEQASPVYEKIGMTGN